MGEVSCWPHIDKSPTLSKSQGNPLGSLSNSSWNSRMLQIRGESHEWRENSPPLSMPTSPLSSEFMEFWGRRKLSTPCVRSIWVYQCSILFIHGLSVALRFINGRSTIVSQCRKKISKAMSGVQTAQGWAWGLEGRSVTVIKRDLNRLRRLHFPFPSFLHKSELLYGHWDDCKIYL